MRLSRYLYRGASLSSPLEMVARKDYLVDYYAADRDPPPDDAGWFGDFVVFQLREVPLGGSRAMTVHRLRLLTRCSVVT